MMNKNHTLSSFSLVSVFLAILLIVFAFPLLVSAQEYVSLSELPGVETNSTDLPEILNIIYVIIVIASSIFAVIKIALAGVQYMMSDVVTNKESAKNDIRGAILGLVIILATYLVLATIYPGLIDFNVLEKL